MYSVLSCSHVEGTGSVRNRLTMDIFAIIVIGRLTQKKINVVSRGNALYIL